MLSFSEERKVVDVEDGDVDPVGDVTLGLEDVDLQLQPPIDGGELHDDL